MPDAPRRERRSPMVMLLDAMMRLAIAAQSGPQPKLEAAGRPRRAGFGWLVVGAVLAVAGTGVVVGALLTGRHDLSSLPPHAAARAPAAEPAPPSPVLSTPVPGGPGATVTATPSTSASPSASGSASPGAGTGAPGVPGAPGGPGGPPPAPPAAVPLTAAYEFTGGGTGLLGYPADVAVTNPGTAARNGWQLTLTLSRPTLQIAEVSGAVARQDGATWTFEPDDATRTVPPGGSVRISFQVRGATLLAAAPQDCRIDGRPCAGVGGSAPPG